MKTAKDIFLYLLIVGLVVFIWLATSKWIDMTVVSGTDTDQVLAAVKGQFGDKFGAANALFSGLAFAGIIITLLLQRRDLSETRSAMGSDAAG